MPILVLKGQVAKKKSIEKYVENLCKELGINRMWSKAIFINFKTTLDNQAEGLCWGDPSEGYVDISIARTSIGKKMTMKSMMQTLAHEMVHAKQYLRGELCGYSMSWKGKKPRNYKYENAPWEREAYKLEAELYSKCWPID